MEGGTLTLRKLADLLGVKQDELKAILDALASQLEGSALALIVSEDQVTLALSGDASRAVEEAYKDELGREIGDAGLEVLATLLYRGPSTRAQIDYIRGVNTSSTIRTLLSRGLIERTANPEDAREYLYRPTPELLAHLGVMRAQDLPEHEMIAKELAEFEKQQQKSDEHHA